MVADPHAARDAGAERHPRCIRRHGCVDAARCAAEERCCSQEIRTDLLDEVLAHNDRAPPAPRPEAGSAAPALTVEAMAEALYATDEPHGESWATLVTSDHLWAKHRVRQFRARAAAVLARLAAPAVTETDAAAAPVTETEALGGKSPADPWWAGREVPRELRLSNARRVLAEEGEADPAPAALAGAVRDALRILGEPESDEDAFALADRSERAAEVLKAALAEGAAGDEPHDATEAQYQEAAAICGLNPTTVRIAYRAVAGVIFDAAPPRDGGRP